MKLMLLIIFLSTLLSLAQQNGNFIGINVERNSRSPVQVRPPEYRILNGNIYNITKAGGWRSFQNQEVFEVTTGGLIFTTIENQSTKFYYVKNCPDKSNGYALGQRVSFCAYLVGTTNTNLGVLELWDCGIETDTPPPEEVAAKAAQEKAKADAKAKAESVKKTSVTRALQSNLDAAAKGDSFGLLRMGERYRDGDGVEKDLAKAREYLQKAAAAGSSTAQDELSKLP